MAFFGRLAKLGSKAATSAAGFLSNPANLLVPGGRVTVNAVNRTAVAGGEGVKSIGEGVKEVAGSAAEGVKKGFTIVALILAGALLLYLWPLIRPLFSFRKS